MTHLVPVLRPVLGTPFRRDSLYRLAGAVPSFDIAPAITGTATDLITGTTLGGGTVNCATPAWDTGPDGILYQPAANTPVIGYDPVTLRPVGLRGWELIVNRSLSTRDLTQAVWVKSSVTATRDQAGADGTANTATRLTATASDGTCLQTLTSASATHVSGFYVRRITGTGTVEITQNGGATWTAITLTSAFQRFAVAAATVANPQIGFRIRSNGDQIAVDFTQCQSASTLGPPLPNASTTLTASSTADVISITGTDFTRIWNQSEGSVYAEVFAASNTTGGVAFGAADTFDNTFYSTTDQTAYRSGAGISALLAAPLSATAVTKIATAFKLNDFAAVSGNNAISTDASGAVPISPVRFTIGCAPWAPGNNMINGYIGRAALFRSRRPNANLQAMTQ